VLDNPHVRWSPPGPQALARALVDAHDRPVPPAVASASVRAASWDTAARTVVSAVERTVAGAAVPS
jgi:hypothetical protein